MRIIKLFESFVAKKDFKFETNVINPLLEVVRDNVELLCQEENRPQLAKLMYIFANFWYAGRLCWGTEGIIRSSLPKNDNDEENEQGYDCEDNPKYKIEMCWENAGLDEEELVYDAWAMHVTSDNKTLNFEDIKKNVYSGKVLTAAEAKSLKQNKTFDDWVDIMTDESYRYKSLFPDRRSVLNHLLCVAGNGYEMNENGYMSDSSDKSRFGDWENSKFTGDIKEVVDKIFSMEEVKETLNTSYDFIRKSKDERHLKDYENFYKNLKKLGIYDVDKNGILTPEQMDKVFDVMDDDKSDKLATKSLLKDRKQYKSYYPLSNNSLVFKISDEESLKRMNIKKVEQSYIDASIEIARDIITNSDSESESNVNMSIKILANFNLDGYKNEVGVDKYAILEEVNEIFINIGDIYDVKIHLNDTATNEYADNSYNITIKLDNSYTNIEQTFNMDDFKGKVIYDPLMSAMERLKDVESIEYVSFYYQNSLINIKAYTNKNNNAESQLKEDIKLDKLGFNVGIKTIIFKSKNLGLMFKTSKPETLGSKHPNNKDGKGFYSLNKQMEVYEGNNVFIFNIDERNFNILTSSTSNELTNWILEQYDIFKASNKDYGDYNHTNRDRSKEGKLCLYAHDFIVWLDKQKK